MQTARFQIQGLEIHAFVGLYAEEQVTGNDFLVDVAYSAAYVRAAETDRVEDTVNYVEMCGVIVETFKKRCHLLEQIAHLLVTSLKEHFPGISEVSVTVTKLNPPISQRVKGISITVNG